MQLLFSKNNHVKKTAVLKNKIHQLEGFFISIRLCVIDIKN